MSGLTFVGGWRPSTLGILLNPPIKSDAPHGVPADPPKNEASPRKYEPSPPHPLKNKASILKMILTKKFKHRKLQLISLLHLKNNIGQ